jgi:hypothetical protein
MPDWAETILCRSAYQPASYGGSLKKVPITSGMRAMFSVYWNPRQSFRATGSLACHLSARNPSDSRSLRLPSPLANLGCVRRSHKPTIYFILP